jgi:hypothetical protein
VSYSRVEYCGDEVVEDCDVVMLLGMFERQLSACSGCL